MPQEAIVALPVAGWELRTVPALDALLITISFLATPMDRPQDVQARTFALHRTQARELAQRILSTLGRPETDEPPGSPPAPH